MLALKLKPNLNGRVNCVLLYPKGNLKPLVSLIQASERIRFVVEGSALSMAAGTRLEARISVKRVLGQ